MFTLYILKSLKNHLYVGVTKNLQLRIKRHKSGNGAEFTKRNKVFKLVYKEEYTTRQEAMRREIQLKSWTKAEKETLIRKVT